jgi:hypothetical protein
MMTCRRMREAHLARRTPCYLRLRPQQAFISATRSAVAGHLARARPRPDLPGRSPECPFPADPGPGRAAVGHPRRRAGRPRDRHAPRGPPPARTARAPVTCFRSGRSAAIRRAPSPGSVGLWPGALFADARTPFPQINGLRSSQSADILYADLSSVAHRAMWGYGVDPPSDAFLRT